MFFTVPFVLILFSIQNAFCLDNGEARKPPMGWLSWARYECNVDCDEYPDTCIHENLYKRIADRLVSDGYRELGYNIVGIDDCWSEKDRDPVTNRLVPDRKRFPSGMKALADYMHERGLKLGIYGDVGPYTCAKYPGQNGPNGGFFQIDAQTFADWEIDAFKFDGCFEDPSKLDFLYAKMELAFNKTGRRVLYICEWPLYQSNAGIVPNYEKISKYCNTYRNHDDVEDRWTSISSIIDYYASNQETFAKYNGPGMLNDPDMLLIGNFGLTKGQSRAQMAMWAMWSSPLLMSTDLENIDPEAKRILQNKEIIAVNQDPLGKFGKRVMHLKADFKEFEAWVKELSPTHGKPSWAVVYLNRFPLGSPFKISIPMKQLINCTDGEYSVKDLFGDKLDFSTLTCDDNLTLLTAPSGSVRMVKITKNSFRLSSRYFSRIH